MKGIISGILGGVGAAGLDITQREFQTLAQKEIENERAEIQRVRDERLQAFQAGEAEKTRTHASGEAEKTRTHAETLQGKSLAHAETLQGKQFDFTRSENALARDLQRGLAEMNERGADRRHGASMGVQLAQLKAMQEKVALQPMPDGTILKVGSDGESRGFLSHPLTGEPIKGQKTLTDAAKIIMQGNEKIIAALETAAAKNETTPEERTRLTQRIDSLNEENKRLAGMSDGRAPADKRTGWDSASGKVMAGGVEIGTAKSEAEARSVYERHIKGAPAARPAAGAASGGIVGSALPAGVSDAAELRTMIVGPLTPQATIEAAANAGNTKAREYLERQKSSRIENDVALEESRARGTTIAP